MNSDWWQAYRLRLKRRRLLWWAIRRRHELYAASDRTRLIRRGAILGFATVRNEAMRLPYFLDHYRRLGVDHFLIVDNTSDDGTAELLSGQPDVSLWRTRASYRASRFGMDWINWLLLRHGAGHWCLTVDADELLVYPEHDRLPLSGLTARLDALGAPAMAALMLDLYPRGPLSQAICRPGANPTTVLDWFDPDGYVWEHQERYDNISIRGGVRRRVFFADRPELAPHLHKTPLVRWRRPYAYLSSTHILLPRNLNRGFDARLNLPTGALLHTKFLAEVLGKSHEDRLRREHFTHADRYDDYYSGILADPDFWVPGAVRYQGWQQLVDLGLMAPGR